MANQPTLRAFENLASNLVSIALDTPDGQTTAHYFFHANFGPQLKEEISTFLNAGLRNTTQNIEALIVAVKHTLEDPPGPEVFGLYSAWLLISTIVVRKQVELSPCQETNHTLTGRALHTDISTADFTARVLDKFLPIIKQSDYESLGEFAVALFQIYDKELKLAAR